MKVRKKRVGTKAQIRAVKERERRIAVAIFLVFILIIVFISAYFTHTFLNQPENQTMNPASSQLRAAIVDQLSLTFPNQSFIETATNTLKQAGYSVDYYPGEEVTVEFYGNLPTLEYGLIILRAHSALCEGGQAPVALFTSEPYDKTKYVYEQLFNEVTRAHYFVGDEEQLYFAIFPDFVWLSMNGRFDNTTIVMMGCNGLTYTHMAEAFTYRGAKVCISWNEAVSASRTDQATIFLLQHLALDKQTIKKAVDTTMEEVGTDPVHESKLIYCPLEAGDQTIEKIIGNSTTKP